MMYHIDFDVHAHWSDVPPGYRIYVNNDMITERTFTWPSYQNYIREHLICELENGPHAVYIENCGHYGKFALSNLTVNNQATAVDALYENTRLVFSVP